MAHPIHKSRASGLEKYLYCCVTSKTKEYMSEKVFLYTAKACKRIVTKTKQRVGYAELILCLSSGLVPAPGISWSISITVLRKNLVNREMKSIFSNIEKEAIITDFVRQMPELSFPGQELDQLYYFSVEYKSNRLSQEELINKLTNWRSGIDLPTESSCSTPF